MSAGESEGARGRRIRGEGSSYLRSAESLKTGQPAPDKQSETQYSLKLRLNGFLIANMGILSSRGRLVESKRDGHLEVEISTFLKLHRESEL